MAERFDVVVVGAGPGGYTAAFRAADLGLSVALVDEDPLPGGTCLLRGCIPSKALLHAARLITDARAASGWGITFAPPQIDVAALRARKDAIVAKHANGVRTLAAGRRVTYVQGRAAFTSPATLRVGHNGSARELAFGHAILATGSQPVIPGALGASDPRIMDSAAALDLPDVPGRLLVVGGGYIGLELGTVYAALGSAVTVAEGLDRLLGGADADLARFVVQRAKSLFAAVHTQTRVTALDVRPEAIVATLERGAGREALPFDRVLVAVGRRPVSANLGLESTQIKPTDKGFVPVDTHMRTAEPTIFCIGDLAGEPMLAHKASHEGIVAAETIAGYAAEFTPRAIPAVVFTDPEVAWCGLTEDQARRQGRAVGVAKFPWSASGRATTLGRNDGLTKLVLDPKTQRVLGVGIAGAGAGDLIAEGVLAVEMGAVAEDLAATIHPHPTLSETIMEAAEAAEGRATHLAARGATPRASRDAGRGSPVTE
jgi:dihydrolipoamide dehydrogenase